MSGKVVAIDGPGGSGKSTVAKLLAQKLDYDYLDTGAMYRAVTWLAIKKNIDVDNEEALTNLAANVNITFNKEKVYIDKKNVTDLIRKQLIDKNVSYVARIKGVREAMIFLQRKIARKGNIIVDGRDIGSRVLPEADIKVFLTASLKERALRRYNDLKNTVNITLENVKKDLQKRDKIDKNREFSPLVKVNDAIYIDTTELNVDEVVEKIFNLITGE